MEKLKRIRWFNRLNSMSIRMSFVLYALFSLLIGIIICIAVKFTEFDNNIFLISELKD